MNIYDIPILIIDDEEATRRYLRLALEMGGYGHVHTENSGEDALEYFDKVGGVPLVLIDVTLPGINGLKVLECLKKKFPPSQCIIVTGLIDGEIIKESLRLGACDFITKPVPIEILYHSVKQCSEKYLLVEENQQYQRRLEELLQHRTEKLCLLHQEVGELLYSVVEALSRTVEAKDPYTATHQKNVAIMSRAIAREMGLPEEILEGLWLGSLLHDIGKLYVPAEILAKPSLLTSPERSLVETHCLVGHNILGSIPFRQPVAEIVVQHHERVDGTGYPRGLRDQNILLPARIIGVTDTLDAMLRHRPYRAALTMQMALDAISHPSYCQECSSVAIRLLEKYNLDIAVLLDAEGKKK